MLTSCRYCGKVHDKSLTCAKKPKNKKIITDIERFRNSFAWRKKRARIKERDCFMCQLCLSGLYDVGERKYNSRCLEVHHITPIKDDYSKRLDDNNLITLCEKHHEMAEKGIIPTALLVALVNDGHIPPAL